MKTTMLPLILFNIFTYIIHCTAAPSCPLPPQVELVKLRVWNKVNGPNVRGFTGYPELDHGKVALNNTENYPGFDVYLDTANPGMIRAPPTGIYGALIPTQTTGIFDFQFISHSMKPGVLTHGFMFKQLTCGMCNGLYLQFDNTSSAGDRFSDLTGAFFILTPSSHVRPGAETWTLQWSKVGVPAGSFAINLLK